MQPFSFSQLQTNPHLGLTCLNPSVLPAPHTPISLITSDSREVIPGALFVALKGEKVDGLDYIAQAITAGASGVIIPHTATNHPAITSLLTTHPVFTTTNCQKSLALVASAFYNNPGQALRVVAVTGTNGKTTVSHLIQQVLQHQGIYTAVVGTLGVKNASGQSVLETNHTTPMAPQLQSILANLVTQNYSAVCMEVSSHALDQDRAVGCDIEVAVFTNLTQDHLDYHHTMDNYGQAKAKLFAQLSPDNKTHNGHPRIAIINADDAYAHVMEASIPKGVKHLRFGIKTHNADVTASNITYTLGSVAFTLNAQGKSLPVQFNLAGEFSVYNLLAAITAGIGMGYTAEQCVSSLLNVHGVRGRFEVVSQTPCTIVDYAHTPDGLENALRAAKEITPNSAKLWAVFGCGGDRDATKRPKMAAIAEQISDCLVVTSDNPRTEDPQQIISDVLAGLSRFDSERMWVEADRRKAIRLALDNAAPNDVVVIAGKGHEDYQIVGTQVLHFDDREEVQTYLATKSNTASV